MPQEYETVGILLLEFYWFIWMSSSQRTARNFKSGKRYKIFVTTNTTTINKLKAVCQTCIPFARITSLTMDHPLLSNLLNKPKPVKGVPAGAFKCVVAGRTTWCLYGAKYLRQGLARRHLATCWDPKVYVTTKIYCPLFSI